MSLGSVLKSLFRGKGARTLREMRGTPEFENEAIKCRQCGHDLGTRRKIREAAVKSGWDSSAALGIRIPCPSCGAQKTVLL